MLRDQEKVVYSVLDELGIEYRIYRHPPVFTVEESGLYYPCIEGMKCKNLFLRDRKSEAFYLVILEETKRLEVRKVSKLVSSGRLSFSSPEQLQQLLGLTPGAVSPFGLINDEQGVVKVVIDNELRSSKKVGFHPNVNTATVVLSLQDFFSFLEWCGNDVRYTNL